MLICSVLCMFLIQRIIFIMLRLYKERLSQVDAKLQEVIAGKAPEYLEPLAALQENMQIRTKVAGKCHEVVAVESIRCILQGLGRSKTLRKTFISVC